MEMKYYLGFDAGTQSVKVAVYDENMQEYIIEGTELLARCLCHEIDHLDGVMYVDKATEMMQIDKEDDEA